MLTTDEPLPCTGWSNSPTANIAVRMRRTMSFKVAIETCSDVTACLSASPKLAPTGISMSSPAFAAATVLCVANQSDIRKPRHPQPCSRVEMVCRFWQPYSPLMRL